MRPRQFTDDEMVCAARACFLEHGPGVATSEIAKALGVSSAALFRRVGSKRELMLRALAPPAVPPFVGTLRDGPDDRPVGVQLEAIAVAIDTFFEGMFPIISVMRAAGIDPHEMFARFDEPPPVAAVRALAAWFTALHEQGRVHVDDPLAAAKAFIGGLQGRHFLRHACGAALPASPPDSARGFARIFFRGIDVQTAVRGEESP
ncbi:MAG: TetR/AcrR family transcriptional regulator [Myxococcota bacterium]